jgi:transglutaminase-like putative cysteine protease
MKKTLLVAAVLATTLARADESATRTFKLEGTVTVKSDARPAALWVPLPLTIPGVESVSKLEVSAEGGTLTKSDGSFAHATSTEKGKPLVLRFSAVIERREVRTTADLTALPATELSAQEKTELAKWLEPEKSNPWDDELKKLAASLAPGEKRLAKIARAAFDHVLANMKYDKPAGKGWGKGSVKWACSERYGNCTDFHALLMNLCRIRGIPARFTMGASIPAGKSGEVPGYHCWCELYLPGAGWVPVDASEAWKKADKRDFYFGNLDADRVSLVLGRDLVLEPKQSGDQVDLLSTGYAEAGGAAVGVERKLSFEAR